MCVWCFVNGGRISLSLGFLICKDQLYNLKHNFPKFIWLLKVIESKSVLLHFSKGSIEGRHPCFLYVQLPSHPNSKSSDTGCLRVSHVKQDHFCLFFLPLQPASYSFHLSLATMLGGSLSHMERSHVNKRSFRRCLLPTFRSYCWGPRYGSVRKPIPSVLCLNPWLTETGKDNKWWLLLKPLICTVVIGTDGETIPTPCENAWELWHVCESTCVRHFCFLVHHSLSLCPE